MLPSIVTICGSSRPGSFTGKSLAIVNDELVRGGHNLTSFDGATLALAFPGQPVTPDALRLREAVKGAAGLILATPEYHGSFSAMLKLIIESLEFPSALAGKPVALLGVAAGRIGAIKSLEQLRTICGHVGAIVVPGAVSIAAVNRAFNEQGQCTDGETEKALRGLAGKLSGFMRDYVCPKHILEEQIRAGAAAPWVATV